MAVNYVKFQRGSQAAYEALKAANKLDDNTLYFIYPEENKTVGALYMGKRIISGGDITIASATLDDLADVIVDGAKTNSFLVKDGDNWVAKELTDVVNLIKTELGNIASPNQVFQGEWQPNEEASVAINRIVGENLLNDGDIVILKKLISGTKYEYTAFIYTKQTWAMMDGSYNANNVYFDKDLTINSKILATTGKNIEEVLTMLSFGKAVLPEKIEPSIILTSAESKEYEVGTSVAVKYKAELNPGSYTYGPATGIIPESWVVTLGENSLETAEGTFDAITILDNTNLKLKAVATYPDGAIPKNSLGEDLTAEEDLLACQIKAGTATKEGPVITGYRNIFVGSKVNAIDLTSTNLRGLTKKKENNFSFDILDEAKQVIIAIPEGKTLKKVADTKVFGIDISSKFVKTTVGIGGADATDESEGNYVKNYNVYTYTPAVALGANKYDISIIDE